MKEKKRSKTLSALSSAALLIPGITPPVSADVAPDNAKLSYRYSEYQEDDIKADGEDVERYDIEVQQFQLITPVAEDFSVTVDLQKESMSGASPITVVEFDGEPVVNMSGASIRDKRIDAAVNTRYYHSDGNAGITVALSDEDDYESKSLSLDVAHNLNDAHTTLSASVSYSDDKIEPTEGTWGNTDKDDKRSSSVYLGISQIINANSIIQTGLGYTLLEGFLSDSYKFADRRPDNRGQLTWTVGYRHYFPSYGALHADYRLYGDDWSVLSNTVIFKWYYPLNNYLQIVPHWRYYSQKKAEFYVAETDPGTRTHSSDYRLSSYGAMSAGLKLIAKLDQWEFMLSGERYKSDGDWGFHDDKEAPGLVEYDRFTLGVSYEFGN